jgi:ABC-type proline/glycine betaine transport system permease subunit
MFAAEMTVAGFVGMGVGVGIITKLQAESIMDRTIKSGIAISTLAIFEDVLWPKTEHFEG